jgi:hypothetical protein
MSKPYAGLSCATHRMRSASSGSSSRLSLSLSDAMRRILNDEGLRALAYDPEDVVEDFEGGIELDDVEEILDHLDAGRGDE